VFENAFGLAVKPSDRENRELEREKRLDAIARELDALRARLNDETEIKAGELEEIKGRIKELEELLKREENFDEMKKRVKTTEQRLAKIEKTDRAEGDTVDEEKAGGDEAKEGTEPSIWRKWNEAMADWFGTVGFGAVVRCGVQSERNVDDGEELESDDAVEFFFLVYFC
jgi:chromosome segregation ATPase